jgi:diphosphomevalonate decarboxylase
VRGAAGETRRAEVESRNDFPTASGLASSASGFAALALAATSALGVDANASHVSDLARRSSASAARSIFGGWVELPASPEDARAEDVLAARPLFGRDHLPLRVLVCVTTERAKPIGSTAAMRATAAHSPYYAAWLDRAPIVHEELRAALAARDFAKVGELAEASAMAMHAVAMAAGIVYFNAATIEVLETVRALRSAGRDVWATIDAGPHVKLLVPLERAGALRTILAKVPGVVRVIEASPGEGARLEVGASS